MQKFQLVLLLLIMLLLCAGCCAPITGKIVDVETGQPIEGAILLVEWTKTHGFGNTYTTSEKVAEVFSDKDGVVKIPGYNDPFVNKPDITIYKPGYVAWNNHWIFPDRRNRTDFEWKDGYVFRLERFKTEYTYRDHINFLYSAMSTGNIEQKQLLYRAFEWERINSNNEMKQLIEIQKLNK